MKYGNDYDGLETSDEIIEAIESIASGRASWTGCRVAVVRLDER